MSEHLSDRAFRKYKRMWNNFTPLMKKSFRRFFRRDGGDLKAFHPSTIAAFKRRHIIMGLKPDDTWLCPNVYGCELMDYLRDTKQVKQDRKTAT